MSPTRRRSFKDAALRVIRRHRRPLAAVLAFLAVLVGVNAATPPAEPTVSVVVASHDLAGGAALQSSDVTTVSMPTRFVPADVVSSADAVGQHLAAPLSARSPITRATLASGEDLARPGMTVTAVPVSNEALMAVIKVGSRIDLLATGPSAASIATDARVVSIPATGGQGLSASRTPSIVVEVSPQQAAAVANAVATGGLGISVH